MSEKIEDAAAVYGLEIGSRMIFISGWPSGRARLVTILGANQNIAGGIYIAYSSGGTDTTTKEFLFNVPSQLQVDESTISATVEFAVNFAKKQTGEI